jgi:hypothetical protein
VLATDEDALHEEGRVDPDTARQLLALLGDTSDEDTDDELDTDDDERSWVSTPVGRDPDTDEELEAAVDDRKRRANPPSAAAAFAAGSGRASNHHSAAESGVSAHGIDATALQEALAHEIDVAVKAGTASAAALLKEQLSSQLSSQLSAQLLDEQRRAREAWREDALAEARTAAPSLCDPTVLAAHPQSRACVCMGVC